eukprot:3571997-Prymnesium_polylepis.1
MSRRTLVAKAVAPCCMPVFNLTKEMLKVNISSTTNINPIRLDCALCCQPIFSNAEEIPNAEEIQGGGISKKRKTCQNKKSASNEQCTEDPELNDRILIDSCPGQGH